MRAQDAPAQSVAAERFAHCVHARRVGARSTRLPGLPSSCLEPDPRSLARTGEGTLAELGERLFLRERGPTSGRSGALPGRPRPADLRCFPPDHAQCRGRGLRGSIAGMESTAGLRNFLRPPSVPARRESTRVRVRRVRRVVPSNSGGRGLLHGTASWRRVWRRDVSARTGRKVS